MHSPRPVTDIKTLFSRTENVLDTRIGAKNFPFPSNLYPISLWSLEFHWKELLQECWPLFINAYFKRMSALHLAEGISIIARKAAYYFLSK